VNNTHLTCIIFAHEKFDNIRIFKGMVLKKMLSPFSQPDVFPKAYDFCIFWRTWGWV